MLSDTMPAAHLDEMSCGVKSEQSSAYAFFSMLALPFTASAALTIRWCSSMSAMGGMAMPGGWTMSMAWMRMTGQTWLAATASFLGMWLVMMVAMMLPALAPMLINYRGVVGNDGATSTSRLTAIAGAGYFFIWTVIGMAVFPLGAALGAITMRQPALARAVPIAAGIIVLMAGAVQFTAWKAQQLVCCSEAGLPSASPPGIRSAWRHGIHLGMKCARCCGNLMTILLVIGVMDLRAMAFVTTAIMAERFAPSGERMARAIGAVIIGGGLLLVAEASGLG